MIFQPAARRDEDRKDASNSVAASMRIRRPLLRGSFICTHELSIIYPDGESEIRATRISIR